MNGAVGGTYAISIGCVLWRRLFGEPLPPARWSLGIWGVPINLVAFLYQVLTTVISFFPIFNHTSVSVSPSPFRVVTLTIVGGVYELGYRYVWRRGSDQHRQLRLPWSKSVSRPCCKYHSNLMSEITEQRHGNCSAMDLIICSRRCSRLGGPYRLNDCEDQTIPAKRCCIAFLLFLMNIAKYQTSVLRAKSLERSVDGTFHWTFPKLGPRLSRQV